MLAEILHRLPLDQCMSQAALVRRHWSAAAVISMRYVQYDTSTANAVQATDGSLSDPVLASLLAWLDKHGSHVGKLELACETDLSRLISGSCRPRIMLRACCRHHPATINTPRQRAPHKFASQWF